MRIRDREIDLSGLELVVYPSPSSRGWAASLMGPRGCSLAYGTKAEEAVIESVDGYERLKQGEPQSEANS